MKKKILAVALLASCLVVSSYATDYENPSDVSMIFQGSQQQDMMGPPNFKRAQGMQQKGMMNCQNKDYKGMKQNHMKQGMHKKHMRMNPFRGVNLTPEQRYKLSILKDEMRLDMKKLRGFDRRGKMARFIGANGFDKAAFIKYSNEMHKKMLQIRADHMEKVFNILTKEQITQLKQNLAR